MRLLLPTYAWLLIAPLFRPVRDRIATPQALELLFQALPTLRSIVLVVDSQVFTDQGLTALHQLGNLAETESLAVQFDHTDEGLHIPPDRRTATKPATSLPDSAGRAPVAHSLWNQTSRVTIPAPAQGHSHSCPAAHPPVTCCAVVRASARD